MTVLGLNAHAHDAGVAIVEGGSPVFVAEEERFNRIKKTIAFPHGALGYCRDRLGLKLADVDQVVFPWRPKRLLSTVAREALRTPPWSLNVLRAAASPNLNVPSALRFFRVGAELSDTFGTQQRIRVRYVDHHLAHACTAFFQSPFDSAAVLVMDAFGDATSTTFYHAEGNRLRQIWRSRFFNSLGILYSMITKYLGFRTILDEGQVMALASVGTDAVYPEFRKLVRLLPDGQYEIDLRYFDFQRYGEIRPMSPRFIERFGQARGMAEPITKRHRDIAYALQRTVSDAVFHAARFLRESLGEKNLCFGGGLALNCVINGALAEQTGFENVYIPPNPNDAGVALGAALAAEYVLAGDDGRLPVRERVTPTGPFLGPEYSDEELRRALETQDLSYEEPPDIAACAARLLSGGRFVGWFQGRGEMGPRALGNRSILADPRDPFARVVLNRQVKCREDFRPYAPSVLSEHAPDFFERPPHSPFMSFAVPVRRQKQDLVPGVVAADGTARIHTVNVGEHPLFHRMIRTFFEQTGVPLVLNTSFNRQEPPVCSPEDAVRTFLRSELDALVMGRFISYKARDAAHRSRDRKA